MMNEKEEEEEGAIFVNRLKIFDLRDAWVSVGFMLNILSRRNEELWPEAAGIKWRRCKSQKNEEENGDSVACWTTPSP